MGHYNLYTTSRLLELSIIHAFSHLEDIYEVRIDIDSKGRKGAVCSFLRLTERIIGFIDGLERVARKSIYVLNEIESNKLVRFN